MMKGKIAVGKNSALPARRTHRPPPPLPLSPAAGVAFVRASRFILHTNGVALPQAGGAHHNYKPGSLTARLFCSMLQLVRSTLTAHSLVLRSLRHSSGATNTTLLCSSLHCPPLVVAHIVKQTKAYTRGGNVDTWGAARSSNKPRPPTRAAAQRPSRHAGHRLASSLRRGAQVMGPHHTHEAFVTRPVAVSLLERASGADATATAAHSSIPSPSTLDPFYTTRMCKT
jgi:hypothetical protein